MAEEKEILCKELPSKVNDLALAFPGVFGALMQYQNISPEFFEYFKLTIDTLSDMGIVVIEEDKKDPKRKSLMVKVCEVINQAEDLEVIIKDIDDHIKIEMEKARKRFELQTGIKEEKKTESGIVLPGSMPSGPAPKIIV